MVFMIISNAKLCLHSYWANKNFEIQRKKKLWKMINRFLVGIEFQSRARCLAFHVAHFFIPFLFSWSQRIDLFAFHVSHTHNHRIHLKIVKLFMFYFMIRFGSGFFALKSTWENVKITKEGASWTNRCQKYTKMYFEVNIFFFLINEINSLFS